MAYELTEEQVQVRMELGDEEVLKRADKLADYQRYDNVSLEGMELTPAQAVALANLAKAMGPDVVIHNGVLKRIKPLEERAGTVLRNEIDRRERERKVQAYKDAICPNCGEPEQKAADYKDKCGACGEQLPYYPYG